MKLKFDNEIQKLVEDIAARDLRIMDVDYIKKAKKLVVDLEMSLDNLKARREISLRNYIRKQHQVGFVWEFYRLAHTNECKRLGITDKHNITEGQLDDVKLHQGFISLMRTVKSEEILKSPSFVKLAAKYGVLELSQTDVTKVILMRKMNESETC